MALARPHSSGSPLILPRSHGHCGLSKLSTTTSWEFPKLALTAHKDRSSSGPSSSLQVPYCYSEEPVALILRRSGSVEYLNTGLVVPLNKQPAALYHTISERNKVSLAAERLNLETSRGTYLGSIDKGVDLRSLRKALLLKNSSGALRLCRSTSLGLVWTCHASYSLRRICDVLSPLA